MAILLFAQLVAAAAFGSQCHTIRNKCSSSDFYLAVAYHSAPDKPEWRTEAWWRVDHGAKKKLCFNRGTYLYAFFDWAGGGVPDSTAVTFGSKGSNFCLKTEERTSINRYNGPMGLAFGDADTGAVSKSCEGLGHGARTRRFTLLDSADHRYHTSNVVPRSCQGRRSMSGTVEVSRAEPMNSSSEVPSEVLEMLAEGKLVVLSWYPKAGQYRPAEQGDVEPQLVTP